jgi:Uma2 family endonuclease
MSILTLRPRTAPYGPGDNGTIMSPADFDRAEFEEGWRYELLNGVLVVTPIPLENETDPNEELGRLLRNYAAERPQGTALNATLPERTVKVNDNRRRADRVIWAGLGRRPRRGERPTIIVEFVSRRSRDRRRDYVTKRDEYLGIVVKEYWVIDRFTRTMSVMTRARGKNRVRVVKEEQVYKTDLLPGFELPLARLLALADSWADDESE